MRSVTIFRAKALHLYFGQIMTLLCNPNNMISSVKWMQQQWNHENTQTSCIDVQHQLGRNSSWNFETESSIAPPCVILKESEL